MTNIFVERALEHQLRFEMLRQHPYLDKLQWEYDKRNSKDGMLTNMCLALESEMIDTRMMTPTKVINVFEKEIL